MTSVNNLTDEAFLITEELDDKFNSSELCIAIIIVFLVSFIIIL